MSDETTKTPLVGVVMGSNSDYSVMIQAGQILDELHVRFEEWVMSAHRTPERVLNYAAQADASGIQVLIAGAGGAAHLAGFLAAHTTIPVIGVPIESKALKGLDSLLSTVNMPPGIPVATVGIDGARNAGLLAAAILALNDADLRIRLLNFRLKQKAKIEPKPSLPQK